MILKILGIITAITFAISLFANNAEVVSSATKLLAPLIVLTCLFGIKPLVNYLKKHGTFDESGNYASGDSTISNSDGHCSTDSSSGDCGGGDGGSSD